MILKKDDDHSTGFCMKHHSLGAAGGEQPPAGTLQQVGSTGATIRATPRGRVAVQGKAFCTLASKTSWGKTGK